MQIHFLLLQKKTNSKATTTHPVTTRQLIDSHMKGIVIRTGPDFSVKPKNLRTEHVPGRFDFVCQRIAQSYSFPSFVFYSSSKSHLNIFFLSNRGNTANQASVSFIFSFIKASYAGNADNTVCKGAVNRRFNH